MRERLARLETAERPAAEGDFVVVDYVGSLAAGESAGSEPAVGAVRRRRGPRPAGRARRRQPDPGLRGGAASAPRAGEHAHGRADVPGRLRQPGARRARRVLRGDGQGGQAQAAARRSTTTSRSTPASTTSQELREDIRRRLLEVERGADRGRVPPGRARRRRRAGAEVGSRPSCRGARAGDVGADAALALPPRDLARGLPAGPRAQGGGDPRRDAARRRAGAASRGRDHGGRRGRGDRAVRGGAARGARRRSPSAKESEPQAAARGAAAPGASRRCARTSPRARRST